MSKITEEFKATAKKINAKLAEAVVALNEANALADAAGLSGLINSQWVEDLNFDKLMVKDDGSGPGLDEDEEECDAKEQVYDLIRVSDFEDAMSGGGWSSSSSYC